MEIMTKTVVFARVSTKEQAEEGYSLSAQLKLLMDYCERNGLQIVKKFAVPESASGKQERKLFNEMLEYLSLHSDTKNVVCEKVDRITRNFKDAVSLDEWINQQDEGIRKLHFVKQNLIIDKNSKSTDTFVYDIFLALSKQYSRNLSEETRKGLDEKASQGWYPGNKKRGYKTVGDTGHRTWVIDDSIQEARFITKAYELYNTGNYSLKATSKELFLQGWNTGGKPISIGEMHKLLIDPFYSGEFVWNGKRYQGKHPPIISKDLYEDVMYKMSRKTAGKYRKHSFVFGGEVIKCADCGRSITAEVQKGNKYYHCTQHGKNCSQNKYVREEKLEEQVIAALKQLQIENPRLQEWIKKALKESHKDEVAYHEDVMYELEERHRAISKRLHYLYDDMVDERVSKEFYQSKRQEYESELEAIARSKEVHAQADLNYMDLGINIFELSQKGADLYQHAMTDNQKRELVTLVFSNIKLSGEKLDLTFQNGFELIASRAKSKNWLPD